MNHPCPHCGEERKYKHELQSTCGKPECVLKMRQERGKKGAKASPWKFKVKS